MDVGLYTEELYKKGLVESSIELYSDVIQEFLATDPKLDDIDCYNTFLVKHVYKKKSYYYYYALKQFIKWKISDLALRKTITNNLVKPKDEDPNVTTVYMSEVRRERLIENIDNIKHNIIARLQFQTGARIGDILRLERGCIIFENYKGKAVMKINFIGKRAVKNPKWIFDKKLQEDIMDFLKENYLDDKYYFIDPGKSFKNSSITTIIRSNYNRYWRDLKEGLRRMGLDVKSFSTHDFRRSIARDIWDNEDGMGKDVQLLQQFLAHKNTATTLRYLKHSGLSNRDVAEKLAKKSGKLL